MKPFSIMLLLGSIPGRSVNMVRTMTTTNKLGTNPEGTGPSSGESVTCRDDELVLEMNGQVRAPHLTSVLYKNRKAVGGE